MLLLLIVLPYGYNEYYVIIQLFLIAITFEITILCTIYEAANINQLLNKAVSTFEKWLLVTKETVITKANRDEKLSKNSNNNKMKNASKHLQSMEIINNVNAIGTRRFVASLNNLEIYTASGKVANVNRNLEQNLASNASDNYEIDSDHNNGGDKKNDGITNSNDDIVGMIEWKSFVTEYMPILAYWKARFNGIKIFGLRVDIKFFFRLLSISVVNILIVAVRARVSWIQ